MTRNRNGIPNLTRGYFEEMKKGCNSANCPPLGKSTSSRPKQETGVTLERYPDISPPVK